MLIRKRTHTVSSLLYLFCSHAYSTSKKYYFICTHLEKTACVLGAYAYTGSYSQVLQFEILLLK